MSEEEKYELRQQMYLWCISNGLAKNKEEAKKVLKENGFLLSKQKKEVIPEDVKLKINKYEALKTILKDLLS